MGVPIPSARAVSISFHPSSSGSIRSSTQTSGFSNRSRARPSSPRPTTTGSKPAATRWRAIPSAITLSSSTIRTRATTPTIVRRPAFFGFQTGDDLVTHDIYDRSFDELRTGFTAAVSHELRTPLARILALLDSADLPGADVRALIDQAREEVESAGALIDEILFLSELESGKEIVSLGHTNALSLLGEVLLGLEDSAARAGVELAVEGDPDVDVPLRPRMLRIVAENLAENAVRYAGHGSRFTFTVAGSDGFSVITAADDGAGVSEPALSRLFERF